MFLLQRLCQQGTYLVIFKVQNICQSWEYQYYSVFLRAAHTNGVDTSGNYATMCLYDADETGYIAHALID